MVRLSIIHVSGNHAVNGSHIFYVPLGVGLFVMASVVVALCANHGGRRRASRKEENKYAVDNNNSNSSSNSNDSITFDYYQENIPPRSPLRSPKQLIATISNKAMSSLVVGHKRSGGGGDGGGKVVEEGFGEGGLWQKEILMGVKCQPPEFSGVIYYNCDGHQVSEFPPRSPRSPRIAPSPEFTFPVTKSPVD